MDSALKIDIFPTEYNSVHVTAGVGSDVLQLSGIRNTWWTKCYKLFEVLVFKLRIEGANEFFNFAFRVGGYMLIGDCRVTSVRLRDDFSHIACKLS
jgi:hypothetical protein